VKFEVIFWTQIETIIILRAAYAGIVVRESTEDLRAANCKVACRKYFQGAYSLSGGALVLILPQFSRVVRGVAAESER
jgi:hypothetical protein